MPEVPASLDYRPELNAALVWDGDCDFCARWAARAMRLRRRPLVIAWQDIEDLESYGLRARECYDALQWVEPGRKESGARAVGRLLRFQGGLWRLVAWTPFVWPFSSWAASAYDWVARNRRRFKTNDEGRALQEKRRQAAAALEQQSALERPDDES